jgi:ribose transport system ATP-binding protein
MKAAMTDQKTGGNDTVLEMRGICKSFGPVSVLRGVDLTLRRGQVLGLIGENGAGKSTLIKILCGIYPRDAGTIAIDKVQVEIKDAATAQRLGISTIYQELSLIPDLNAAQNIFLNREKVKGGRGLFNLLDAREMREVARKVLENELKMFIDIDVPLRRLPLAQKQMVEIARSVHADAKIIIMDEPTAALEAPEREQLFAVIRALRERGRSIIFISHHLDEILQICDTVHILRDGNMVAEGPVSQFSVDTVISNMVGRSLKAQYPKPEAEIGGLLMKVTDLSKTGVFKNISFELHEGEVIGIVGLEGCGKNEVIRSIFGNTAYNGGTIEIRGENCIIKNVKDAMKRRIAFVPGERKTEGLFLLQDVAWNTTIAAVRRLLSCNTIINNRELTFTNQYIERLHTRTKGPRDLISNLSGGNQQKVMLSRWIMTDADIFLLEEPTRGIDVNAKTEVYMAIGEYLRQKKGVVIVSSEEEEVASICSKVIVMRNGEITAVLDADTVTTEKIKYFSLKNEGVSP